MILFHHDLMGEKKKEMGGGSPLDVCCLFVCFPKVF